MAVLLIAVSQGLTNDGSEVFLIKLKRVFSRVYLNRLVDCFWPSVSRLRNWKMWSEVMEATSIPSKWEFTLSRKSR